ncbi:MAG TPA: hypothetical protein VFR09_08505 [Alphaproteobacteria bacterium]|nr:hypothetical protein [Alphaproteobacteria bacterium]
MYYGLLTDNRAASVEAAVLRSNGRVDAATARSYLNQLTYGGFDTGAISALPLRLKMNLADAIASDKTAPASVGYLNALYDNMGLDRVIAERSARQVKRFFDPANMDRLAAKWDGDDFAATLSNMTLRPQAYDEKQKLKMMQFISDAYNDHIGAPRTEVKLFDGPPEVKGSFVPGKAAINVNRQSPEFMGDFTSMINTVVHENTHNYQHHISKNPNSAGNDALLARLYGINMRGYINAKQGGMSAYQSQPIELGAHVAGYIARDMVKDFALSRSTNDNWGPRSLAAGLMAARPTKSRAGRYAYDLAAA